MAAVGTPRVPSTPVSFRVRGVSPVSREWRVRLRALGGVLALGALTGCTGHLDQPLGQAVPCEGCRAADNASNGAPGAGDDNLVDSDRPQGVGDPDSVNGVGWSTRFPRLSNAQWLATVNDLFRVPNLADGLRQELPPLSAAEDYATQAAAELTIAGDAWSRYQSAAEEVVAKVILDDSALARLMPEGAPATGDARASAFIRSFGRRAYRRALSGPEVDAYVRLFKLGRGLVPGDAFKAGMRLVLEAMLQSPYFLYRVETTTAQGAQGDGTAWLSADEVATRLSYALWGSMPSDALFAAADAGELDTAAGVSQWAKRLLADARASEILLSFHEQTFDVDAYGTADKDPSLGVDVGALAPLMQDEARRFFDHVVVTGQGGIAQLLTEPLAFVNARTAPLYGLSGITGDALQKVELDPRWRSGLLTQLGFLTKNATRKTSDPVHRGLVVLRKVLCDEPDPPPMMFELPAPVPGLTTREVYEKATACGVGCHDTLINPPGFALEMFDALGRLRTEEAGKPIDARGKLTVRQGYTAAQKASQKATTLTFDGAVDLMRQLSNQPRVHECYARNWGAYVLARRLDPVEYGAFQRLRDSSIKGGDSRDLLVELVKLDTFRARISE